jgi:hypothetical protein
MLATARRACRGENLFTRVDPTMRLHRFVNLIFILQKPRVIRVYFNGDPAPSAERARVIMRSHFLKYYLQAYYNVIYSL